MLVILAKNAGFCFGVKRAVDAVVDNLDKKIVTLGPLIHNKNVVSSLKERGARCVAGLDEVNEGETVVIRSHGAAPWVYETLDKRGIPYIDATCPFVKRIHERVREAKDEGFAVIIVGEAGHPEVDGIIGWAGDDAYVVYTDAQVNELQYFDNAVVVAQTTITEDKWQHTLSALEDKMGMVVPFKSICSATQERQQEARAIAERADTVIVVGGKVSSNTRKLYELCSRYCKNVIHIEHYRELLLEKMCLGGIIGIVAGASTPDTMIREVYDYMIENEKALPIDGEQIADTTEAATDTAVEAVETAAEETVEAVEEAAKKAEATAEETAEAIEETLEESAETVVEAEAAVQETVEAAEESIEETVEAAPEEEKKAPATEQDEFLEGLEKVVRLKKGQLVSGNIVQITVDDVCVNIGYKSDGIIPKSELAMSDADPKDGFNVGDEIEAEVVSLNDGEGNVLLSRKRIERRQQWVKMKENVDSGNVYKCVIKKAVKGGVTTKIEGYSAFIPASHLALRYIEDLKEFEGQEVEVMLIDADKRQERLVASRKNVLLKEKREQEEQIWGTFVKGEHINGVVKRLTDFGAFVDVGGVDGLLHISDLAWSRVKHPSDIVSEGQELELLILNVDVAKKKIALGYKQLQPKPWDMVPEKYHAGDVITGKIVRIVPFGAFVQLEPTVDGLVHISQVSTQRLERVEDELRLGDEIEVKILEVDAEKHKISLSRKALLASVEEPTHKRERVQRDDSYNYELPPVQESTVSLADFFPKNDE